MAYVETLITFKDHVECLASLNGEIYFLYNNQLLKFNQYNNSTSTIIASVPDQINSSDFSYLYLFRDIRNIFLVEDYYIARIQNIFKIIENEKLVEPLNELIYLFDSLDYYCIRGSENRDVLRINKKNGNTTLLLKRNYDFKFYSIDRLNGIIYFYSCELDLMKISIDTEEKQVILGKEDIILPSIDDKRTGYMITRVGLEVSLKCVFVINK